MASIGKVQTRRRSSLPGVRRGCRSADWAADRREGRPVPALLPPPATKTAPSAASPAAPSAPREMLCEETVDKSKFAKSSNIGRTKGAQETRGIDGSMDRSYCSCASITGGLTRAVVRGQEERRAAEHAKPRRRREEGAKEEGGGRREQRRPWPMGRRKPYANILGGGERGLELLL